METLEEKRISIVKKYRESPVKDTEFLNKISKEILDTFKGEWRKGIGIGEMEPSPDLSKFLMHFIKGKFKKQIKMNICAFSAFSGETLLFDEILRIMREKHERKQK